MAARWFEKKGEKQKLVPSLSHKSPSICFCFMIIWAKYLVEWCWTCVASGTLAVMFMICMDMLCTKYLSWWCLIKVKFYLNCLDLYTPNPLQQTSISLRDIYSIRRIPENIGLKPRPIQVTNRFPTLKVSKQKTSDRLNMVGKGTCIWRLCFLTGHAIFVLHVMPC